MPDKPDVADVGGRSAGERDDLVLVRRPVDVARPMETVPVLEIHGRKGQLDTGILRRPDVLQRRREAGGHRQEARQEQVLRIHPIGVDGARQPVVEDRVIETHVRLIGFLPRQVRIRNGAGLVAANARRAKGVELRR